MSKPPKAIVIIGSGLAAYTLATTLRRLEAKADQPPAQLTLITAAAGEFYPKPMLSTALTHNKTPSMLVTQTAQAMEEQLKATLHTHTRVTKIDTQQHQVWIEGHQAPIVYTDLVLACGARPLPLQCQFESDSIAKDILTVNNLEDYRIFRKQLETAKRIAIIGAGLVGCEFANDLINGGKSVDVIAMADQPLERLLPPPVAQALQNRLSDRGVSWYLNSPVVSIQRRTEQPAYAIHLPQGHTVQADLVLSAIGLTPNIELAQSAGLEINRGIMVDHYLQTSDPSIYALGDCAEVKGRLLYFVAPLRHCAQALAHTLAGTQTAVVYPAMPVLIKTPACPTVVAPPPEHCKGSWTVQGQDYHFEALFHDDQDNLRGFALTGDCTRERAKWATQLQV